MPYHDIFDEYAKLALERGLIKQAKEEPKESKELKSYKSDAYPRAGSDTIEVIENLYNTKPNTPKSMQYDKNIMEIAHPDKVILTPAYDKINALIENNIERQKILINITQKPVNGHLTQHKYAVAELTKSLIQIANDMDNRNLDELRILADTCAEQLHKKSIAPLVIGAVAAIAVAGGLMYLKMHSDFANEGLVRNGLRLISELDDIITSGTGFLSTRSEYSDQLKAELKHVQMQIQELLNVYGSIHSIIDTIEAPRTADELSAIVRNGKMISTQPGFKAAYELFKAKAKNIQPMLDTLSKDFASESYKTRQIKDEGAWSKINDFFGGVFYGGKGFIADEFDDVRHAIPPFQKSIAEILEIIAGAESAEKDAVMKLQQAQQTGQYLEQKQFQSTPEGEAHPAPEFTQIGLNNTNFDNLESQVAELEKMLKGEPGAITASNTPMNALTAELLSWRK
jgi:hypothetical protein